MAQRTPRRNEKAVEWLRAAALAAVTWLGLTAMHVSPAWLAIALGLCVGGLAVVSPELGVLVAVAALSIPIIAAQPLLGFTALVLGVVAVRYLGADGGRAFLIVGIAVVGAFFGPVWAAAALAGYLLGASEGALAAAVACIVVESIGVAMGRPAIGVTIVGGPAEALVTFANMPGTMLSVEWLRAAFVSVNSESVNRVVAGFSAITQPVALIAQPALWALGAGVAGLLGERARKRDQLWLSVVAAATGVAVIAAGTVALLAVLGLPVAWSGIALALGSSLVVACAFVAVWERFFPPKPVARVPVAAPRRVSMASEDADVDELLRLIATAEDQLQSRHTTNKIVMITDMKSFSRMTEEDGSVVTAKAIQRHRDLLLPVIERNGGSGKSTGGDGLVAAFETPEQAVTAAAEMQRALVDSNTAHPNEREIWVRIGLASGEVVLDKGGRPFIGAALNLAARVMNLADGGQAFATADVAATTHVPGVATHSFGQFELKNIAKPVEVFELLWAEDQQPHDPRENIAEG